MLMKPFALMGLAGLVLLAGCGGTKEEAPTDPGKDGKSYSSTYSKTPSSAGTTSDAPKEASTEPAKDAKPAEGKEITTASGLKYVDVKVGTGESPKVGQQVSVYYTGTFADGKEFDSSKGKPFSFEVGGNVIKGWNEAIMTMKVGGKRKLIIPGDLAYGPQGYGPIPPNATLLFDIELLSIK